MKIIKQLKDSKGRNMDLYYYKKNNKKFLFKEIKIETIIEYELLVKKIARKLSIKTLKFLRKSNIQKKKGLLMEYLKHSALLCDHKKELNKNQKRQLQKIILLDILIGNKDRHTANLFVNKHITAFDHDKILKGRKRKSSAFVKLDIGKKLDKDYIEKLENIIKKGKIDTETALIKYFGFNKKDISRIKSINNKEFFNILNKLNLEKNEKRRIVNFLIYRRDNFDNLPYA